MGSQGYCIERDWVLGQGGLCKGPEGIEAEERKMFYLGRNEIPTTVPMQRERNSKFKQKEEQV